MPQILNCPFQNFDPLEVSRVPINDSRVFEKYQSEHMLKRRQEVNISNGRFLE